MFQGIVGVAKEIRADLIEVYWILLVPLVAVLIALELFKADDSPPQGGRVLKRVVISVLLLMTFNTVINTISTIGDGIIDSIDQIPNLSEALTKLGPTEAQKSGKWFNLREHIIYVFSLIAYIFAFLGFYIAEALTHFVWAILYAVSPLMILAYIPKQTANITANLYKGLTQVVVWKVLWGILGALLLKMSSAPIGTGVDEWILTVVMNLCIGLAMLMIPMATKSIINDGLEGAASALGAAPALAGLNAARGFAKYSAGKAANGAKHALGYSVRPARNLAHRGAGSAKEKINTRANIERPANRLNRKFSELGMNEQQKTDRRSKIYKKLRRQKKSKQTFKRRTRREKK